MRKVGVRSGHTVGELAQAVAWCAELLVPGEDVPLPLQQSASILAQERDRAPYSTVVVAAGQLVLGRCTGSVLQLQVSDPDANLRLSPHELRLRERERHFF